MRHIVFDTETTGFNAEGDDRLVEIGALELNNYVPTGRVYHTYINPERPIPAEATAVHGIKDEDVADKPVLAEIIGEFKEFIGESVHLVAHNAEFDIRFINAAFKRHGFAPIPMTRVTDTLAIARQMFPGASNSLDALCKRYNVDLSGRTYHGALLDARLLADVFLELAGGRQPELLGGGTGQQASNNESLLVQAAGVAAASLTDTSHVWPERNFPIPDDEQAAHESMLATIKNAMWKAAE